MVKEIITDLNKLSERAEEINAIKFDTQLSDIIIDLKDTLKANDKVLGLTAPQIGYPLRMFAIKFTNDIRVFINPIISKSEELQLKRESCASIPDKEFIVPRMKRVIGIYQTPGGKVESNRFEELAGQIYQHLLDLLDGVLLTDIGFEIDEDFDKAPEEEKEEFLNYYIKELKDKNSKYQEEIKQDKKLKQVSDAIDFMTKVQTGELKLEYVKESKSNKKNKKRK